MTGPRTTVIVPCWNDGRFVRDAVASVRRQDRPVRVVVVDDGSTDPETQAALADLERDSVRVIRQRNRGVSGARTVALNAADTEFVLALDADDVLVDGVLGAMIDALDANPQAAAAWGDQSAFGADDYVNPAWPTLDPWLITYMNRISVTALYRREALEEVGGWTLEDGYEDWDVWLALAEKGWSGAHIGRPHLRYRQHDGSDAAARGLARDRERHDDVTRLLRDRHPNLFTARRWTRGESIAPRAIRWAFSAIDAIPRIGDARRHRLHDLALRALMPSMRPLVDGRRQAGPLGNVLRRLR
ncbi:MAG: glycosyltransferase [Actinobacteria bacterium]|nr:glycosyltransferase [Actinomycetota bacterium]